MSLVTIGLSRVDPNHIVRLYYNNVDFTGSSEVFDDSITDVPTYSDGETLADICNGTTLNRYCYSTVTPYFFVLQFENSPTCGYIPGVCDLAFPNPPVTTNETVTDADDGSVIAFATSSAMPITYVLDGDVTNETGFFENLAPGEHTVVATDDRGCTDSVTFTIYAAEDPSLTRFKYRLRFFSVLTQVYYELRFLDQVNQWPIADYPIDLTGTDQPIIKKTTNSDEDKTVAILPSSIRINLLNNGETFTVDEFANSTERHWKIELYKKTDVVAPVTFNCELIEQTVGGFIDGGLQLKQNGIEVDTLNSTSTVPLLMSVGSTYSLEAFVQDAPIGADAKIRMTIMRGATVIYDKQIPAVIGASMVKGGIVQSSDYTATVTTLSTTTPVTEIDIADDGDPYLALDWQGWLLPDEIQDLYADAQYPVQLIATDGLLSLKGDTYSDLSIYNVYDNGQKVYSPIFGIRKWAYLMRICLEHLGYDYGETTLISSLVYDEYNADQWLQYSTWSDIFYDNEDNPISVHDALTLLLKSLHLQIYQHNGHFVIVDINDLYYRNQDILAAQFYQSVIQFNRAFDTVSPATFPTNSIVGYNKINRPINPQQTLNYDKSYNRIEAKIDFNSLAILYENPSFEINSVVGDLPSGFNDLHGGISEIGLIDTDAYDGKWSWKIGYNTQGSIPLSYDRFVENVSPFFSIDQPQKTAKISFMWKPSPNLVTDVLSTDWAVTFSFVPVFIDGTSGNAYFLKTPDYRPYNINQLADPAPPDFNAVTQNVWAHLDGSYVNEWWDGDAVAINGTPTTDFIGWQSFSLDTPAFPETGIGSLVIRFYGASYVPFQEPTIGVIGFTGKGNFMFATTSGGFLVFPPSYYLIDNLYITIGDAVNPYNRQIGESHLMKNLTEYAKAEKKQLDLSLFTYPTNKRIAGNFFYGDEYDTALLSNDWWFQLSTEQTPSRLPTNVIKRIAKNYQRPMYKWQGDVLSDAINYYMVFTIEGIPNRVFIPFTIEMDLRNSVGNIVLIEIDDTNAQDSYLYTPLFEKSARNNIT